MNNLNCEFLLGVEKFESIPNYSYPEFAFIGRSNVGKSSLLNSIVNRKNLAHVSSTPGKTQQINIYRVNGKVIFADLPGFGYASVAKTRREDWLKLNTEYLLNRENLNMVFILVDARHEPLDKDLGLIEMMENRQRDYMVILTKTDKIKPAIVEERKKQFEELTSLCSYCKEVLPYSSKTGLGRFQLLAIINKFS